METKIAKSELTEETMRTPWQPKAFALCKVQVTAKYEVQSEGRNKGKHYVTVKPQKGDAFNLSTGDLGRMCAAAGVSATIAGDKPNPNLKMQCVGNTLTVVK